MLRLVFVLALVCATNAVHLRKEGQINIPVAPGLSIAIPPTPKGPASMQLPTVVPAMPAPLPPMPALNTPSAPINPANIPTLPPNVNVPISTAMPNAGPRIVPTVRPYVEVQMPQNGMIMTPMPAMMQNTNINVQAVMPQIPQGPQVFATDYNGVPPTVVKVQKPLPPVASTGPVVSRTPKGPQSLQSVAVQAAVAQIPPLPAVPAPPTPFNVNTLNPFAASNLPAGQRYSVPITPPPVAQAPQPVKNYYEDEKSDKVEVDMNQKEPEGIFTAENTP